MTGGRRRKLHRVIVSLALLAIAAAVTWTVADSGDERHRVVVVVPQATGIIAGFEIRAAGRSVGAVESVDLTGDYQARLTLGIDDAAWPLSRAARLTVKRGGPIKYSDRYLELDRGAPGRPAIPDGGRLPTASFHDAVEFDELFRVFDARTRRNLRSLFDTAGPALSTAERPLRRALDAAPPALSQTRAVLADVGHDRRVLTRLVRSTDSVVDALATASPGIGEFVSDGATTMDAVGAESRRLEAALAAAPQTLATTRRTLAQADGTLADTRELTDELRPGVHELRALASPLSRLLGTLRAVAPDATTTLATLRRATPDLGRLLRRARSSLLPSLESIGRQAAKQLDCVRPFTPEIAGWISTWGGITSQGDRQDKYARAQLGVVPYPTGTPLSAGQVEAVLGDRFGTALPRPPGQIVGQPWFQPQCGIGPESLDPASDPEATGWDPLSKRLIAPSEDERR